MLVVASRCWVSTTLGDEFRISVVMLTASAAAHVVFTQVTEREPRDEAEVSVFEELPAIYHFQSIDKGMDLLLF